jgi:hypothetical protein
MTPTTSRFEPSPPLAYIETTIPSGMTLEVYRRSRPQRPGRCRRLRPRARSRAADLVKLSRSVSPDPRESRRPRRWNLDYASLIRATATSWVFAPLKRAVQASCRASGAHRSKRERSQSRRFTGDPEWTSSPRSGTTNETTVYARPGHARPANENHGISSRLRSGRGWVRTSDLSRVRRALSR